MKDEDIFRAAAIKYRNQAPVNNWRGPDTLGRKFKTNPDIGLKSFNVPISSPKELSRVTLLAQEYGLSVVHYENGCIQLCGDTKQFQQFHAAVKAKRSKSV